jgi:hypothetical protein
MGDQGFEAFNTAGGAQIPVKPDLVSHVYSLGGDLGKAAQKRQAAAAPELRCTVDT